MEWQLELCLSFEGIVVPYRHCELGKPLQSP